jgi:hypothetical protein
MHPDLASRGHVAAALVLIHDLFRYSRGLLLFFFFFFELRAVALDCRPCGSLHFLDLDSAQKRKSIRAGPGAQVRHEQENQLE